MRCDFASLRSIPVPRLALSTALLAMACALQPATAVLASEPAPAREEKIGVLLASHGDIDDVGAELKDYISVSFQHNVGIPLPLWSRQVLTPPAYALSVKTVTDQYDIIGSTHYRAHAELQRAAVTAALRARGLNATAYLGFNFTTPYIEDTVEQMRKDGVTTIVVFNKGAQFSYASSGENMEDVLTYLNSHPDYDARAVGYREYSDDDRFRTLMATVLDRDAKKLFPGVSEGDICLFVASHGLPMWLINKGDPAVPQMKAAVEAIRGKLPGYRVYHGFLNDDFFPGAQWIGPKSIDLAPKLLADGCRNIMLDGRLSFTTHHRATLFDLNYETRNVLMAPARLADGSYDFTWKAPKVILADNFDGDPAYAELMATLTEEALSGVGPIVHLKNVGEPAMPRDSVGKPGVNPYE